jgi:hypothetical protein
MIDVDQHIQGIGLDHVRYVDDIRIFGDSLQKLERCLADSVRRLCQLKRVMKLAVFVDRNVHSRQIRQVDQVIYGRCVRGGGTMLISHTRLTSFPTRLPHLGPR